VETGKKTSANLYRKEEKDPYNRRGEKTTQYKPTSIHKAKQNNYYQVTNLFLSTLCLRHYAIPSYWMMQGGNNCLVHTVTGLLRTHSKKNENNHYALLQGENTRANQKNMNEDRVTNCQECANTKLLKVKFVLFVKILKMSCTFYFTARNIKN